MLPPFHGERMRAYEEAITEVAAAEIATWPIGTPFALHPSMQAITLEVIMRAVFGVSDPARREAMREGLARDAREAASPVAFGLTPARDQGAAALPAVCNEGRAHRRAPGRGDR